MLRGVRVGPGRRYLAAHGVLHRPDGRCQLVEPAQASAQGGSVSAVCRVNRFAGRIREPGQPRPQECFRGWLAVPVSRRKRAADASLGLGEDGVRRVAHLGDDLPAGCGAGLAPGHQPQPEQVRMAARLVITYLVSESHRSSLPRRHHIPRRSRSARQGRTSCCLHAQPDAIGDVWSACGGEERALASRARRCTPRRRTAAAERAPVRAVRPLAGRSGGDVLKDE
jgi:hypothetical protein